MPRKPSRDYAVKIRALQEERDALADELEEANAKLDEIDAILSTDEDDEDGYEDDDE